jgi:hypothetical protein
MSRRPRNQGAGLKTTEHPRRHLLRSGGGSGSSDAFGGSGAGAARLAALLSLTIAALLVLSAGSASALTTRQLQTQITGTCPAPGNCPAAERLAFAEPEGLTVDSSGRLWVADRFNHAIDRFSAAGSYEAQNSGAGAWEESTELRRLAFSASADEVFAADSANEGHLFGLEPAGAAFSGKNLALGLGGTINVAADNSLGATGGDLYVSNGTKVLRIKAADGSADDFTAGPGAGTNELTVPFTSATRLAVAPDGTFYVGGTNGSAEPAVFQFDPSGEFTGTEFTEADGQHLAEIRALAVEPGGEALIVADGQNRVFEFESSGTFLREITKPRSAEFLGIEGLAADASGHLFVSEASSQPKLVDVFGPVVNLPDVTTGAAVVHSTTSATLEGEVNPAGQALTECFFQYGMTTAYGQTAACEPGVVGEEGEASIPVHADITALAAGAVYHYRLVAADAEGINDESGDREVVTGAGIDATSASGVTATSATLETEVNPHGLPTTYSFRYGPTTAYGSETPMPPAPLGEGTVDVARSAFVSGFQPGTTYHFQAIATNTLGTVEGPDRSFTTQPASSSTALPDGRGWELVSPVAKQGVRLGAIQSNGGLIQAAAGGSGIAYYAPGSIVPEPAGDRSFFAYNQYLSTRTGSGWATADLTTPHQGTVGAVPGNSSEYKLFSTDLSHAALEPFGATPLSPAAGERTPYLRSTSGSYQPLVTASNVPPGTHFGGHELRPEEFEAGVEFITATPDLSHLLLESPSQLVAGFQNEGQQNIYEWTAGTLTQVSLIPPGGAPVCGGDCVPVTASPASVGVASHQVRNAISANGSRVVFRTGVSLFLRDIPGGETVQLDAAEPGCTGCGSGRATFQYASSNDSRVFFTDAEPLTEDSTAAPAKPDLYMCEIVVEAGHLACALTDLTANSLRATEPANVHGAVIGGAEDGSSVYFVADGALTVGEGAVQGDCQLTEGSEGISGVGECNLYRYDAASSTLSLVAVLSGADYPDWNASGPAAENLREVTARVSPDGEWLAFMSERSLTGYDSRDVVSGEPDEEVFLDHSAPGAAGDLICASCNPTGARPAGRRGPTTVPPALVEASELWSGRWYAANVPGWTPITGVNALYQSRYLSDSGRLFFNSSDALVPQDTDGTQDVYEYEPSAVGGCTEASPSFAVRNGGCIGLISSGTSASESAFMDASESGDDVFFLTASRLTEKDEDAALDLYDARVGGGESPAIKPVECSGDACQQPAVPPAHPTPGTLLVNGPENVKQCPKGKKLQKGKCVKKQQKKSKKGKKKSKKGKKKSKKGKKKNSDKKGKKQKNKRSPSHKGGGA